MLTHARLLEVLTYDPETGVFYWRKMIGQRAVIGQVAGGKRPDGYIAIAIDGKTYKASRLAWLYMKGEFPPHLMDHEDRDRANNQWLNLRPATKRQNNANKKRQVNNKVGLKGVNWHKASNKYVAQISNHGKKEHLGLFTEPADAHAAYVRRAKEIHGEFFTAG